MWLKWNGEKVAEMEPEMLFQVHYVSLQRHFQDFPFLNFRWDEESFHLKDLLRNGKTSFSFICILGPHLVMLRNHFWQCLGTISVPEIEPCLVMCKAKRPTQCIISPAPQGWVKTELELGTGGGLKHRDQIKNNKNKNNKTSAVI